MVTRNRVKQCIMKIVKDNSITEDSIKDETLLSKDLGLDSIMMIELIVEIEEEFDIEIDDEDLVFEEFDHFSSLVEIVDKQL